MFEYVSNQVYFDWIVFANPIKKYQFSKLISIAKLFYSKTLTRLVIIIIMKLN